MRARLVPALLVLGLGLSACSGGDGEASPTIPPVTDAPSPSAAATPTQAAPSAPQDPAEFAQFFVNEVFEAYESLDAERVSRLSDPACQACQRYVATIGSIRERDATIRDDYSVEVLETLTPGESAEAATVVVTLITRVGPFVVTDPDGTQVVNEPAADQIVQSLTLLRTADSWRVAEMTND